VLVDMDLSDLLPSRMARPLRIVFPGAFYHITLRGNEQKAVFKTDADREKFFSYLKSATERYEAIFHIYCLMRKHYHRLLETPNQSPLQIKKNEIQLNLSKV
jgi:putative transposase